MLALKRSQFSKNLRKQELNQFKNKIRAQFQKEWVLQHQNLNTNQNEQFDFIQRQCPFCLTQFIDIQNPPFGLDQDVGFEDICNFHLLNYLQMIKISNVKDYAKNILTVLSRQSKNIKFQQRLIVYFTETIYTLSKYSENLDSHQIQEIKQIQNLERELAFMPFVKQIIQPILKLQLNYKQKLFTVKTILIYCPRIIFYYFWQRQEISDFSFLLDLIVQTQIQSQNQITKKQCLICFKELLQCVLNISGKKQQKFAKMVINKIQINIVGSFQVYISNIQLCLYVMDIICILEQGMKKIKGQTYYNDFITNSIMCLQAFHKKYKKNQDFLLICSQIRFILQNSFICGQKEEGMQIQ